MQRKGRQKTGFEYMWAQIKELELVFMKLGEKTKRLKRVKSHLQSYLDELCWRCECRELADKREYLVETLNVDSWQHYINRIRRMQEKTLTKHGLATSGKEQETVTKMYDEVMRQTA